MKTEIELSLAHSSSGEWFLRATEATSRILIFEARLTPQQFSDLMHTVPAVASAELNVSGGARWGKRMEVETFEFEFDRDRFLELEAQAAAKCVADGWLMDREASGSYNPLHVSRGESGSTYKTIRRRWVDVGAGELPTL